MKDEKFIKTSTNQSIYGKYKISIIDENNNVVVDYPWQKNLILNQGMDMIPTNTYADVMNYAAAGNGTRTNSVVSGNGCSGSVINNIFTLSPGASGSIQSLTGSYGGYGSVLHVGDVIQFADAETVTVTGVSNLTASVLSSPTISSQSFTIWETSQVGLQAEIHRVGPTNFFPGVGYCGSTIVGTTSQNRRTWDFDYETSPVSFTEVGVGWASTGNNTIFSRVLLPATVTINNAQKMRLIYELDVTVAPPISYPPGTPITASILGWGTGSVVHGFQSLDNVLLSSIQTSGVTSNANAILEPAATTFLFVSNITNPTIGGDLGGTSSDWVQMTTDAYVPGSYTLYKNGTFAVAQIPENDLRTLGIGWYNGGAVVPWAATRCGHFIVLTENQTKTNVQTLTLTYVWTWGRVLS